MRRFEINCDLGESVGNDHELMPMIDACSIACGGHTGDEKTMTETVRLAKAHQVKVGAHPSWPDRAGFGRKPMNMAPEELKKSVTEQIRALEKVCETEGVTLDHVKPHGALYSQAAKDAEIAKVVLAVLKDFPGTKLYAPWQSVIARLAAKEHIPVVFEAFADRKYARDGTLASRSEPGSLIEDPISAAEQAYIILTESRAIASDLMMVEVKADTLCVHGDNPAATGVLSRLNQLREV